MRGRCRVRFLVSRNIGPRSSHLSAWFLHGQRNRGRNPQSGFARPADPLLGLHFVSRRRLRPWLAACICMRAAAHLVRPRDNIHLRCTGSDCALRTRPGVPRSDGPRVEIYLRRPSGDGYRSGTGAQRSLLRSQNVLLAPCGRSLGWRFSVKRAALRTVRASGAGQAG